MEQNHDLPARLHYDLRLAVNPETRLIQVAGSLVFHAVEPSTEHVPFYLHNQLDIQSLSGPEVLGYHFEKKPAHTPPFLGQAGLLDVYFKTPLDAGKTALIQFEYQGKVTEWPETGANLISEDWVELGLYLPWYPLWYQGSPADLTFTLQANFPPGYSTASYGASAKQNGDWFYNWTHPTNDIVVAASPSMTSQVLESESNRVLLHSTTLSRPTAHLLGEDVLWTLERFAGWFGPIRPAEFTLIESARQQGGGYARRGLVVLAGLQESSYMSERENTLHYLAHEAAHLWWWQAPVNTWEDWLNESFAEYSALLALRERYGQEAYTRQIEKQRERSAQAPALWEFDRADLSTPEKQAAIETHLYEQGPLLLDHLAERIGQRRFLDLCRGMQWSGVQTTGQMLDLLEELEGNEARAWMESALKGETQDG